MKLLVVAIASVLVACGASEKPPSLFGTALTSHCAKVSSEGRTRCAAWLVDQMVTSSFGKYDDRELERYVRAVGMRIARVADRPKRVEQWTFRILDDPDVRAHAQLAGYVYVSRGALAVLASEAELAALLAHEIAHVVAGHSDAIWDRLDDDVGNAVRRFERDRDDERQADELAIGYLAETAYDPGAMVDMLASIHRADAYERSQTGADADDADDEESWQRSHPPVEVRLARAALVAGGRSGRRFRQRYIDRLDGLVLGADPRDGRTVGHHYVYARGRLAFELDSTWATTMEGRELRASRDGVKIAITPMSDLYARGIESELADTRALHIGGFAAKVGWYSADDGSDGVRRIGVIETPAGALTFVVKGASRGLVERIFAFVAARARPPRKGELDTEPRRISLVRLEEQGSVGELAAALCAHAELTVVLEGGDGDARREAGDRLKCAGLKSAGLKSARGRL